MPALEITQLGINSVAAFDPFGNSPTGNFNYCNVYNVDPTTFDKTAFKALTSVSAQVAYLASVTTGARNGYNAPPTFPYQGNAIALNRNGTGGTTVANQVALRVTKKTGDSVNYLHQIQKGFGDYYWNLLVVYNTILTSAGSRPTDQNMPIAFICLLDGFQRKTTTNEIQFNTIATYSGLTATIEFVNNPVTTGTLLEVSIPDLLPTPTAATSNVYLIRNQTPPNNDYRYNGTIARLNVLDILGHSGNISDAQLWAFDGYSNYFDTWVIANGSNSVYRTAVNEYRWIAKLVDVVTSGGGYILQVLEGTYQGQCRRLTTWTETGNYTEWSTAFGGIIPTGTSVRIHIPDRLYLENNSLADSDAITYGKATRATNASINSTEFVYDGWATSILMPYPTTDLNLLPNKNASANYLVNSATATNKPSAFTSGYGELTLIKDTTSGFARQTLKSLNATDSNVWERTVKISDNTATAWLLTANSNTVNFTYNDINANNWSYTMPGGLIVKGGIVTVDNSGSNFTFAGLGHTNFPNKIYQVQLTWNSEADNAVAATIISTSGFSADHNNSSNHDAYWTAWGK